MKIHVPKAVRIPELNKEGLWIGKLISVSDLTGGTFVNLVWSNIKIMSYHVMQRLFILSTKLIMWIGHCREVVEQPFWALTLFRANQAKFGNSELGLILPVILLGRHHKEWSIPFQDKTLKLAMITDLSGLYIDMM